MSSTSPSSEEFTSLLHKRQKTIDFNAPVFAINSSTSITQSSDPEAIVTLKVSEWQAFLTWTVKVQEEIAFQRQTLLQMDEHYTNRVNDLQRQIESLLPMNHQSSQVNPSPSMPHPVPSTTVQPPSPSPMEIHPPSSDAPFIQVTKKKAARRVSNSSGLPSYAHALKQPNANLHPSPAVPSSSVPLTTTTSSAPTTPNPTPNSSFLQQPPKQHHRTLLRSAVSHTEKLKLLLRKSSPPVQQITSIYFKANLSKTALKDPIHSIKVLFQALTNTQALGVSLISPTQFEVFLPAENLQQVTDQLQAIPSVVEEEEPEISQIPTPFLTEKDVKRRAASYNRGHFQLLRRACLESFPPELQLKVLQHAKVSVPNLPPARQQQLLNAISEDMTWIQSQSNLSKYLDASDDL